MRPKRRPISLPARRRQQSQPAKRATVALVFLGQLAIDRHRHEVTVGDRVVHLTPREFQLLWTLTQRPGKVYRREELLTLVWGTETFVAVRTVDVHMAKLRRKLRTREDHPDIVETIWGVGYRLQIGPQ